MLPFLGYTVLGSDGSLSARFKVLIFFHPHESKRLCFKTETGDPCYFRGSGICANIRLHKERVSEKEIDMIRNQFEGVLILRNLTVNHRGDQRQF